MKNIKNIFKATLLMGTVALSTTSCQDWLTVYPQTQIVEENFWEDKNDLEGVRYAAYKNMCSTLDKMVLWGDLRSDTYDLNSSDKNTGTQQLYQEIREGKLDRDSASTYFEWGGFYTTINFCNKVLNYGPIVLERDKQFTPSEWNQMKAEITALRALNYFYLLRSFKDVPYTTKVINNDTEVEAFGATNQLVVLDSIITDVEAIQGQARNRFSKMTDTKGLITNSAIYAMLSDMYLWRAALHKGRGLDTEKFCVNNLANAATYQNRMDSIGAGVHVTFSEEENGLNVTHTVDGDYELAVFYADKAMEALNQQNEENRIGQGFGMSIAETVNYGLTNCNLIKNEYDNYTNGNFPRLYAFQEIYMAGNSDESIFELQFNASDSRKNDVVTDQWGYSDQNHLSISDGALGAIYSNTNERNRDSRLWFSAWNKLGTSTNSLPGYYCFKWYTVGIMQPESNICADIKLVAGSESFCNWPIYRLSDVMLQKAEALVELNRPKEAVQYINALHRRWYCNDSKSVTGQPSENVKNADGEKLVSGEPAAALLGNAPAPTQGGTNYEIAVMNERQLEFIGEGKRWFDLVRYAERHAGGMDGTQDAREYTEELPIGNGKKGVDLMVDNFLRNQFSNIYQTLKNRFKNRYGLYNIIYYMEIKASADANGNRQLEQNPVWNKSTYEQ